MLRFMVILVFTSLHISEILGEELVYVYEEPSRSVDPLLANKYGNQKGRQLFGDDIPTHRPLSGNYYADYEGFPNQGARNKGKKLVYAPTFQNKATFTNDHNFVYTGGDAGRIYQYSTSFVPYVRPTPKSLDNSIFPTANKVSYQYQQTLEALESEQVVVKHPPPEDVQEEVKMMLDFVSDPIQPMYSRSGQHDEESSKTSLQKFMRGMFSRLSTHLWNSNWKNQANPVPGINSPQRRNSQNGNLPANRMTPIGYKLLAPYEPPSSPNQPQQTRS